MDWVRLNFCYYGLPCLTPVLRRHWRTASFAPAAKILSVSVHSEGAVFPNDSSAASCLRRGYDSSSTDGVMSSLSHLIEVEDSANEAVRATFSRRLIEASVEAGGGRSGDTASILNGVLGGCVKHGRPMVAAEMFDLLRMEYFGKDLRPDLVTCSCVFRACRRCLLDQYGEVDFLERISGDAMQTAIKLGKKLGGSARRRALAKSRRRGPCVDASAVADVLALKYGVLTLYEDDNVVGISKPNGMVCRHHRKTTQGKRGEDMSLEDVFTGLNIALSSVNPDGRGLVHRLDRGTSGCMVLAKNDAAHLELVAEFFLRGVDKSYLAMVPGIIEPEAGVLNMEVDGRPARSRYRVERAYSAKEKGVVASMVRLETDTGRNHQVRVHCAHGLRRPIFLDATYAAVAGNGKHPMNTNGNVPIPHCGSVVPVGSKSENRLFLHACSLRIPRLGFEIDAPIPGWWKGSIDNLDFH